MYFELTPQMLERVQTNASISEKIYEKHKTKTAPKIGANFSCDRVGHVFVVYMQCLYAVLIYSVYILCLCRGFICRVC